MSLRTTITNALPPRLKKHLRPLYQAVRAHTQQGAQNAKILPTHLLCTTRRLLLGKGSHTLLAAMTQTQLMHIKDQKHRLRGANNTNLPAARAWSLASPSVVTAHFSDPLHFPENLRTMRRYKNSNALLVCTDPRTLLLEPHPHGAAHYAQSADQGLFADGHTLSFSNPGLLMMGQALLNAPQHIDSHYLYTDHDPVGKPAQTGPHHTALSFDPSFPPATQAWWATEHGRHRVLDQMAIFPELEHLCRTLGYASTDAVLEAAGHPSEPQPWSDGIIIAFHTDDPVYTAEAQRYSNRLQALGLRHHIQTIPPRENWVSGCAVKPTIVQDMRRRFQGPLLYTDVDAYVHTNPWPRLRAHRAADLAAHVDRNGELQSGTLYIGDTPGARTILDQWVQFQQTHPQEWDQRTLQKLVHDHDTASLRSWRFERMSPAFTFILDRHYPFVYGAPIIEHLQASRERFSGQENAGLARRRARITSLFGTP